MSKKLQNWQKYLADRGSDGLLLQELQGNLQLFPEEEKLRIYETVIKEVKGKLKVIAEYRQQFNPISYRNE